MLKRSTPLICAVALLACGSARDTIHTHEQGHASFAGNWDRGGTALSSPLWAHTVNTGSQYQGEIANAARSYRNYQLVKGELDFAPAKCAYEDPLALNLWPSVDVTAHEENLFLLYVKGCQNYASLAQSDSETREVPAGTVIVKETFMPRLGIPYPFDMSDASHRTCINNSGVGNGVAATAMRGGTAFEVAGQAELLIMIKKDPGTAGTDNGWIYGATDAMGMQVLASGLVQNCASCHADAKHDRLFSLGK